MGDGGQSSFESVLWWAFIFALLLGGLFIFRQEHKRVREHQARGFDVTMKNTGEAPVLLEKKDDDHG